ncbi:hypothetical protein BU26DRAFT_502405 [Trematosphaeria pertusa]|uniref:Uncharacterized protein n=1 Tax=Trematosphaeria pertusa TaxID=390896 RepID=A0A6A6IQG2_9PLEO|nr:uncharacterized protein BU26DRAFT_502405 [Trematosphaeria pertusa]KAF2251810.1 hypothetical protein BU26DRAFT_502405 [Trematosphaeria pertusa]
MSNPTTRNTVDLYSRLLQLTGVTFTPSIESTLTKPQKRQLANNLLFLLLHNYGSEERYIKPSNVHFVLDKEGRKMVRYHVLIREESVIQGAPVHKREEALAGLRAVVERAVFVQTRLEPKEPESS